jgi:hypothetical protein
MGAVSNSVLSVLRVMELGVSPAEELEGKAWSVRLYFFAIGPAREVMRSFAVEGWAPMFILWFIIAVVRSGRAFTLTPPFMTSTATEVVIRYFIPGDAFAASRANLSFFSFLEQP